MKTKLIFLSLILFSIIFYSFTKPNEPLPVKQQNLIIPCSNEFLTGAMSSGDELEYDNMQALNLNLWHVYTEHDHGWPGIANDLTFTEPSVYAGAVNTRMINNYNSGMRTLSDRPKFQMLAYAQRSDYQCENTHQNQDLWFYTYNIHTAGTDEPDGSVMVKHCSDIAYGPNAGWVCKDLKTNREQCNRFWNYEQRDSIYPWLVKPRIRIPVNAPVNNPEGRVCRVDVLDWNGDTLDSRIIYAKNFAPFQQGNLYTGNYLEEYFYNQTIGEIPSAINISPGYAFNPDRKSFTDWGAGANCKVDFRVWWYDEVEMWIDYVRVDNQKAHDLFNGIYETPSTDWIKKEVEIAINQQYPGFVHNFYIEEFEFNILPCVKYVNEKIKYWSAYWANQKGMPDPHLSIDINLNYDLYRCNIPNWGSGHDISADWVYRTLIGGTGGYKDLIVTDYPLASYRWNHSFIPNTLPVCQQGNNRYNEDIGLLADSRTPDVYDTWLQGFLDNDAGADENGEFIKQLKIGSRVSQLSGMPFVPMLQTHLWHTTGDYQLREPTNEELKMMANVSVTYGAKGILWFWYDGWNDMAADKDYGRGLTSPVPLPLYFGDNSNNSSFFRRDDNAYKQWSGAGLNDKSSKFNTVADLNYLLKNVWGPYLTAFDDDLTHSYIYRLEDERNDCITETYFRDIVSYKTGTGTPPCVEDYPDTNDAPHPNGLRYECNEDRYLQVASFKKTTNDGNKYFMIVNRRCSPFVDESSEDNRGGRRFMRVYFDQNHSVFNGYNSWKIVDIENMDSEVGSFDKTALVPYVDLGWFDPGQGKLFTIMPILPKGGTLVADEVISGGSFTCEAPVYNNGFDITIESGTTIHFNDSSRFIMNGGVFTVGNQSVSGSQNITCDAVNGTSWLGHSFTNCEVKIYGANFTGITNDTAYSLNIIDCPVVDIRNCTFNSAQSLKGAVNAVFYNNPFSSVSNVYLYGNTFNSSGSTIPTVNISSYAGLTLPLIIEGNTFNNGNTAVFLTGVTGGAIKGNTITDNYYGLNVLTSSVDIFENTISSSINGSIGIFSAGGSEIRLNKAGIMLLGGQNTITNTGSASNNIKVEGATFLLADGENVFDIASNQSAYHLYGWFPYFTAVSYDETDNCFKVDNSPVDPPINLVTDGYQGSPLSFTFQPYLTGCEIVSGGDGFVINLGDGIYDTLYNEGQGAGGSRSSVASVRRTDIKQNSQTHAFDLPSAKNKYDSISVLLRYRNYPLARTRCIDLINTYPDSIQSLNAISKLFLASTATDTTINGANELKIYYENLILNHPNNVSLVKRANYFILKCKVRMKQYSQALAGFQQIINQNPYSYEGLIARWDYMATTLLAPQGGAFNSDFGSVISDLESEDLDLNLDYNPQSENRNPESTGEKNPFTKEQRQDIRKSINTAIEISKNDDETKMKSLEQRSQLGDVNASRELSQMNSLKQVVKTEKPNNILQHVRIISEDIRKVFGEGTSSSKVNPNNLPTVYRLSQNYPNPFNPVTKINYDLPSDAKVTIIIYDILGREVKRLVNNEVKKAGAYIVDFNAMIYASGVYFYRIEAEETRGFKFTDSKKMVLLK